MSIHMIPKSAQAYGQFNGGAILENKPIGFPQEGGALKAYSNLVYWAHAWSDAGSVIGEHPHRGFEIMSFVLKGSIEHYDSKYKKWIPLESGSAQIIRSGNGISHAEKLNAGAHMFQIWLDPNLEKTLQQEASYDDYAPDKFPPIAKNGIHVRQYAGPEGPMHLDTEGIIIEEWEIESGSHSIPVNPDHIHSAYLIEGKVQAGDKEMAVDDFFVMYSEETLTLAASEKSRLFVIQSPKQPSYKTYMEQQR